MARCSNIVVCIVNFLTILFAVPLISFGYWLKSQATSQCQHNLPYMLIVTGIALLVLALLGIFGSCCRLNCFMCLYLFFMFLLIAALSILMTFAFVVTNKQVGDALTEFKLENRTSWVQKWVTENWDQTEMCMRETKLCGNDMLQMLNKNKTMTGILNGTEIYEQLAPIEISCCQPPSECGFTNVNGTWLAPKSGITSTNVDCKTWSNSEDGKCYSCNSCKAEMVATERRNLRLNAYTGVVVLVYLVIIYSIGCCAYRNNRSDKYRHYR